VAFLCHYSTEEKGLTEWNQSRYTVLGQGDNIFTGIT
jgi:hypothetical protein